MPDYARWNEYGERKRGERFRVSQRGPAGWSSVRDRQRAILEAMPDGSEILIGHWFGVRCCFSFGCDFRLCPIVPDEMRARSERAESGLVGYELMYWIRFFYGLYGVVGWFSAIGGFFAFPAVFFGAFPICVFVVGCFSCFEKPPVSSLFRSFSAHFRQLLLI
ncbi:hypothetical protein CJD36_004590 [Flavipsychrobacter stenotrophus]|uniref:Uncharacterized protein n=1 Tax=Flavipsychrobacter stenotrophus TaxID=2077091 RepID=A0A2S7T2F6_9BACT|nr:hypothetical protein CJD36_004590 [Flavipsychrobacter stenotrophus]